MCEGCPSAAEMAALLEDSRSVDAARWLEKPVKAPWRNSSELEDDPAGRRGIWLSAGAPPTTDRAGRRVLLLVRDAVSQLCRALFESKPTKPVVIIMSWDPVITPIVLDSARTFGPGTRALVQVYLDDKLRGLQSETIDLLDWARGEGIATKSAGKAMGRANQRGAMLQRLPSLRGAVFIGGDSDVYEDAMELKSSKIPLFAVASTGGAADRILHNDPLLYSGGNLVPERDLKAAGSYIGLMREIVGHLRP
jgi:hypothetical protein